MRKFLRAATLASATLTLSSIAQAADLGPLPPSPPPQPVYVAPVFTWTGFYIGGNLGVAWTKGDVTDSFGNGFRFAKTPYLLVGAKSVPTIRLTGSSSASKQISTGWQITKIRVVQFSLEVSPTVCQRQMDNDPGCARRRC